MAAVFLQACSAASHAGPTHPHPQPATPAAVTQPNSTGAVGCESASPAVIAAPRDANGNAIRPWGPGSVDRVADEGDAILRPILDADAAEAARHVPDARAFAAAHADQPYAHYVLGRTLSAAGQREQAVAAYSQALQLQPGFVEAEHSLGIVLTDLGRADEALEHFERAEALDPAYRDARIIDASYNAGLLRYLRGDYDRALAHWCAARARAPEDFNIAKKVVQALNALGRFDDADRVRAAARELFARSEDPAVRRLRRYVIDQIHVGDEVVMAAEALGPQPEDLQYLYTFDCQRGGNTTRVVTLEASGFLREQGFAAIVGVEFPDGSHATTRIGFREAPPYATLRPIVVQLIGELQRGDGRSIGASSHPSP